MVINSTDAVVEKATAAILDAAYGRDEVPPGDAPYFAAYMAATIQDARAAILSLGLTLEDLRWAAENAVVVMALRDGIWQAVPKVATRTMIEADGPHEEGWIIRDTDEWAALLAAAPKSPSEKD